MDLPAIERALAATEARPVLVDARLVRRVIKRHRRLPGVGLQVPHARCYAIGRAALLDIVGPDELGRAAADLPEDVILLPRPEPDDVRGRPLPEILAGLWRYAFHARVHLEIDRLDAAGVLTPARIRERIHRIGQTEFDEIRLVLRQDRGLLPPGDDRETYAEFAAIYLELLHFAPALLGEVFPTLAEAGTAAALAEDLDVPRLLEATHPEGAAPPGAAAEARRDDRARSAMAEEAPVMDRAGADALLADAAAATAKGNTVRAALLRMRAGAADAARADAATLAERLDRALQPSHDGEARESAQPAPHDGEGGRER